MSVNPAHLVERLFAQVAAEHFDFTITLSDREDEGRWLQLRGNTVNVAYPHTDPPETVFAATGVFGTVSWDVVGWEPGRYATVDWGTDDGPGRIGEQDILIGVLTRMLETHLGLPVDSGRWVVEEQ
ncbi:hypothetical protein AB0D49_20445 [Streptomyces sp. NPDC048290]|uniref:hypothetical protein n=1 Tax=Streptomyces sp. NPDC048290 TaxID=3155811 RepID=UPI003422F135